MSCVAHPLAVNELKPFDFHPTGLAGVWAGRAPLFRKDVRLLVQETGVTHVLDLREAHEWSGPGRVGLVALEELEAQRIERLHLPIRDVSAPRAEQLRTAADWLTRVLQPDSSVYVHCRAGRERTAAVLLAYLASTGVELRQAYRQLAEDYPLFRPLSWQVQAVEDFLCPELRPLLTRLRQKPARRRYRDLPCARCGANLRVGENVASATCRDCCDTGSLFSQADLDFTNLEWRR